MKITVIICTKNSEENIRRCLSSVYAQTRKPDEVIVVDGNSVDRTVQIVKEAGVDIVISDRGGGLGYARQLGVEHASGELVCFIDSDTWSPPDWLEKMRDELEKDDELVAVQDFYVSIGRNWVSNLESYFFNVSTHRAMKATNNIATGIENSIWIREFLLKNRFDSRFRLLEDLDLLYRVNKMGAKTLRTPNVFHIHFPRKSLKESYSQYWYRGYYTAYFHNKHRLKRRNMVTDVLLTPVASVMIGSAAFAVERSLWAFATSLTVVWKRTAFIAGYSSFPLPGGASVPT